MNLREVGCGRAEVIIEFKKLDVVCTCLESDQGAHSGSEARCQELGFKIKLVRFHAEDVRFGKALTIKFKVSRQRQNPTKTIGFMFG